MSCTSSRHSSLVACCACSDIRSSRLSEQSSDEWRVEAEDVKGSRSIYGILLSGCAELSDTEVVVRAGLAGECYLDGVWYAQYAFKV